MNNNMKLNIDEELHGRSLGWICPQCGRVHAPFVMECFYCNDKLKSEEIIHYPFVTIDDEYLKYTNSSEFNTNLDPCIITPPWESDYSKYKSEVTTDTYKCEQNVTTTNGYFPELDEFNTNCDRSIHKYSSQESLQESLDGLNKELENIEVQPTSLDELKDIKTIIKDIHQSEEIAQDESNNIPDNNTSTQDSAIDFLRREFPIGGINRGNPRIITKCEYCGAIAYLNKKCPICDKFNGDKSLELDASYMLEHWICSRCGKIHLVFPEGGCECGAPLEYLTYVV